MVKLDMGMVLNPMVMSGTMVMLVIMVSRMPQKKGNKERLNIT